MYDHVGPTKGMYQAHAKDVPGRANGISCTGYPDDRIPGSRRPDERTLAAH